jgi:hypothetical protein
VYVGFCGSDICEDIRFILHTFLQAQINLWFVRNDQQLTWRAMYFVHTLPTCFIYMVCSNNNSGHFSCITIYHIAVSQFRVEGIFWKFAYWNKWTVKINYRFLDCSVIMLMQYNFKLHVIFRIYRVFKHFSHFSSTDITTMTLCVCCLWNSLEQVRGSVFVARGFVKIVCVCVCVCVVNMCLWVEGINFLLF